jgi:GMP synthase (glutamine-hydrolysing)
LTVRVLVVGDRTDSEPGLVGQRLEQLGGELTLTMREDFPPRGPVPGGDTADLVVLLGSASGVMEPGREDAVGTEAGLVRDCLDRGVPVMAICYGAQLAAHALGGTVERSPLSEVGWYYVESHDPSLCPPGPWAQYHYDRFTVPEGARLLGESEAGPQGFAVESDDGVLRLVAWQFHPEVTPEILDAWVHEDPTLQAQGVDPEAIVEQAREREATTRAATYALVDIALDLMALVPARA